MSTFKNHIIQCLEEAFIVNKNAIKIAGIFKRQNDYKLGRFKFFSLTNLAKLGKHAIATTIRKDDNQNDSLGQLVFVCKTQSLTSDVEAVLVITTHTRLPSSLANALAKALNIAKVSFANDDIKPERYNINDVHVYVYSGGDVDRESASHIIKALEDNDKQDLEEAVSTMVVSSANGTTPAQLRLKGSATAEVSKLIATINSLRSTLFLQQVQDNGTCVMFTFGRLNKPTIELLIQRKAGGGEMGPKSFGVNAIGISDGNGKIIRDPCVAVVRIADRSTMLAYSGVNTRLKSIVRSDNQISSNTIAGVPINADTVAYISDWLRTIASSSSAIEIANSWSEFVKNNTTA